MCISHTRRIVTGLIFYLWIYAYAQITPRKVGPGKNSYPCCVAYIIIIIIIIITNEKIEVCCRENAAGAIYKIITREKLVNVKKEWGDR